MYNHEGKYIKKNKIQAKKVSFKLPFRTIMI